MRDSIVYNNLKAKGVDTSDMKQMLVYERIALMPRHLDDTPKRLVLHKSTEKAVFNTYTGFNMTYANVLQECTTDATTLNVFGNIRPCEKKVYCVLQALILEGITCSSKKSAACFELFKVIAQVRGAGITSDKVREALSLYNPSEFYVKELYKAVRNCLFDESDVQLYWLELAGYNRTYPKAVELGMRIAQEHETVKKFSDYMRVMKSVYSKDKTFIAEHKDEFKRAQCTKELAAFMYAYKDSHPEIFDIGDVVPNGGFA